MKLHMAACVLCVQSGVNKGRSIDEGETLFRSSHREILDLYDTNTSSHFRVCFHKFNKQRDLPLVELTNRFVTSGTNKEFCH